MFDFYYVLILCTFPQMTNFVEKVYSDKRFFGNFLDYDFVRQQRTKEYLHRYSHRSVCYKMERSIERPTIINNDVINIIEIQKLFTS
jgi:hypothetical protein